MPAGGCCCAINLQKMDPATGGVIWAKNIGTTIYRLENLPGTNDIIANVDGLITRIDDAGAVVWQYATYAVNTYYTGDRINRGFAVGTDTPLIVFISGATLTAIDYSGVFVWQFALPGPAQAPFTGTTVVPVGSDYMGNGVQIHVDKVYTGYQTTIAGALGENMVCYVILNLVDGSFHWQSIHLSGAVWFQENAGSGGNRGNRGLWVEVVDQTESSNTWDVIDIDDPAQATPFYEGINADEGGAGNGSFVTNAAGAFNEDVGHFLGNGARKGIRDTISNVHIGTPDIAAIHAYNVAHGRTAPWPDTYFNGVGGPPSGPCIFGLDFSAGPSWQLTTVSVTTGGGPVDVPIGGMRDCVSMTELPISATAMDNLVFWCGNHSDVGSPIGSADPAEWFHIVCASLGTATQYALGDPGYPVWVQSYGSFASGLYTGIANACCISDDDFLYVGGTTTRGVP